MGASTKEKTTFTRSIIGLVYVDKPSDCYLNEDEPAFVAVDVGSGRFPFPVDVSLASNFRTVEAAKVYAKACGDFKVVKVDTTFNITELN